MPSIGSLIEKAVVADLKNDSFIAPYLILTHDYQQPTGAVTLTQQQKDFQLRITAADLGDMAIGSDSYSGCGIRRVHLTVEINAFMFSKDYPAALEELEGRISDRLQPSSAFVGVDGRETIFSSSVLKVFGILSDQETLRHDDDKNSTRQRTIQRTFVAAQLA